jgi:hypothetical protein
MCVFRIEIHLSFLIKVTEQQHSLAVDMDNLSAKASFVMHSPVKESIVM